MTWQLALAGLGVGTLVGATGMGGGSLLAPLLVIAFGFNPTVAVGTDLLHGALFKSVGALRHRALGNVQARLSAWMLLGSAPSSLLGVALATWLKTRYGGAVAVKTHLLGGVLVLGALGTLAKSTIRFREVADTPFTLARRDRTAAVLIGLGGGFIVGLTSVGSGVFFGLTMLVVFPLRSAKVVGTDIFHAAALLWIAGAGHLVAGNVNLPAVAWLLVGSIPGVLLGSELGIRVADRTLRLAMGVVLGASGLDLVGLPHAGTVAIATAAGGMLTLVGVSARGALARRLVPAAA